MNELARMFNQAVERFTQDYAEREEASQKLLTELQKGLKRSEQQRRGLKEALEILSSQMSEFEEEKTSWDEEKVQFAKALKKGNERVKRLTGRVEAAEQGRQQLLESVLSLTEQIQSLEEQLR